MVSTVTVVALCGLGLLCAPAGWFWFTRIHIQQPALHDVRCEWRGNQVRISATAYNPNGDSTIYHGDADLPVGE